MHPPIAFLFPGRASQMTLDQTTFVAHSLAVAGTAGDLGLHPSFVAGHGLGEFTAAVAAGVLDADDALSLVRERARLLADAERVQSGASGFVLGFRPAEVERVCAQTRQRHGYVSVAHVNSEQQALIAGNASAVEEALALAGRLGAKALRATAHAGFHGLMMATAQARLARKAADVPWRDARVPLICNVDGRPRTAGSEIRDALVGQLTRPVRWTACMDTLLDEGCEHFLEAGMGRALTLLVRRHAPGVHAAAADAPVKLAAFRERVEAGRYVPAQRLAS